MKGKKTENRQRLVHLDHAALRITNDAQSRWPMVRGNDRHFLAHSSDPAIHKLQRKPLARNHFADVHSQRASAGLWRTRHDLSFYCIEKITLKKIWIIASVNFANRDLLKKVCHVEWAFSVVENNPRVIPAAIFANRERALRLKNDAAVWTQVIISIFLLPLDGNSSSFIPILHSHACSLFAIPQAAEDCSEIHYGGFFPQAARYKLRQRIQKLPK